jgi:CBS-domain-containing membrane protein
VHQVATPIERLAVARPDEPVVDLVARLGPGTGRRALVVDAGGDLVGIVTGSDLDRVLEVAAAVGAGAGAAP